MSSTASPPDTTDDASVAAGTANSNFTLMYIIIAVLVGVLLYLAVRYGRSVLSEWRQLHAAGHGALPASQLGLSMEDIAALPTFTYRSRAPTPSPQGGGCGGKSSSGRRRSGSMGRTAVECVVCLQELEDDDVVRVLPACKHFFHGSCIDVWLCAHSSCPVCRAHPEPERTRLGEVALSPPLPQLRPCGVSPERPTASRILADILARSPLRMSKSPSPVPKASDYILSRSPSQTPLTHGMVDERCSMSRSPQMLEIVVVQSKSPSPIRFGRQSTPRCVGVLERTDVIRSASPSPVTSREDGGDTLSKLPSPMELPH